MGYTTKRTTKDGTERFIAMYRDIRGKARSAGTHTTEKLADKAWLTAEIGLAAGRIGDPKRGRQTLQHYVEVEWFPLHVIEESTRQGYAYLLEAYILPGLGTMRMVEILAWHVRSWVLELQTTYDLNPPTIKKCKVVLDAILTTALNDQVTMLHAGKGVKTPPVATKPRRIITAAQYDRIHANLGDEVMQLLVETDIETGLRWGELTELRVKDLDFETSVLTIARGVVHLSGKGGGDGPRFLVKDYPKDKQWRQVKIPRHLLDKIKEHVARHGLKADELLFQLPVTEGSRRRTLPAVLPDPETLGLTEPNEQGRQYPHGTLTAYQMGKCRCRHCKNAIAAYRATRRAAGIDQPRKPRSVNTDGHISGDWFRNHVWDTALEKADLGFRVTPHGLRHAHASWLLAGGADLQVVKERLGHGSLNTTGLYLHTLPGAGDAALKAMESYRASASTTAEEAATAKKKAKKKSKKKQQGELAEMKLMMAQMKDAIEAMRPGA